MLGSSLELIRRNDLILCYTFLCVSRKDHIANAQREDHIFLDLSPTTYKDLYQTCMEVGQ